MLGEVYDVDSKMLARLDQLEEHPTFYERTKDPVLLIREDTLKANMIFEEVNAERGFARFARICAIEAAANYSTHFKKFRRILIESKKR